jgi:hypothetical protein
MTSSLLAAGAPSDEATTSHEEASAAPLFRAAPCLYHRPGRPNHRTAS